MSEMCPCRVHQCALGLKLPVLTLDHIALTYNKVNIGNARFNFSRHFPSTLYDLTIDHVALIDRDLRH